jgi:transcriptional regulator with XRE-family HTH domain
MHNLPINLKTLRIQKKLKQQDVAEYLNITQVAYGRYEAGLREPDIDTLIRLAELFNVSLDILTGRYVNAFTDNSNFTNIKGNLNIVSIQQNR